MEKIKKILVLVLSVAVISLGLTGCRRNDEHPTSEQPTSKQPVSEHPTEEHPTSEHPQ
jgi:hypothetical protein